MRCFRVLWDLFRGDQGVVTQVGEGAPPEDTPAHYKVTKVGQHMIIWLQNWHKITEKEGELSFSHFGSFQLDVFHQLR